jgi:hypothetical protein
MAAGHCSRKFCFSIGIGKSVFQGLYNHITITKDNFMRRFAVALAATIVCLFGSNEVGFAQQKHKHEQEMKSVGKDGPSYVQHDNKGPAAVKTKGDTTSTPRVVDARVAASMKGIVDHYLHLKDAFANDKTNDAATAGKEIVDIMGTVDKSFLTAQQRKVYEDVEDDAREHAEHIGANAGNIAHQREHFDMLSKDVYDLVKAFGSGQVLYKDFCPMYNDKKGAIWLSETKTIKNPYYGKQMFTCGSVQEELK